MKRIVKIALGGAAKVVDLGTFTPPPTVISNVVIPWITGALYAGMEVTLREGDWSVTPDGFTYQWLRNGVAIVGATGITYTLQLEDVGTGVVSVQVTAVKAGYTPAVATSAPVNVSIEVPYYDQDALAPVEDMPTVTYQALSSSAAPLFGGSITSAGWWREKRTGAAEVAVGAGQSSTAALDVAGSSRFRYGGILTAGAVSASPSNYVETPLKTGGGAQSARWLFNVEFIVRNTDRVQIRLNATTTNPRLGMVLVNGRRIQTTPLTASGITGGAGFAATLVFPTVGDRRIKIYGLNHNQGKFGGVAVPTGASVEIPTNIIRRRVVFLGDSLVNGASDGTSTVTSLDTFIWDLARTMKADEVVQLGIGGTGFVATGGDAAGAYQNRVADVLALQPNALVVVGGRNDGSSGGLSAAVTAFWDATDVIGERWMLSENISTAGNTTQQAATVAAGVPFIDLSDYDDLVPLLTDGVHPTWQGHRDLAVIAATRMGLYEENPDLLTPATGVASTGLAWELPSAAQISAGPTPDRKILAHYYGPQPGAFSNAASDYYESNYLPVAGESGIHAAYGGFLRDRPKLGAPFSTSPTWQRNMQAAEIVAAKQAGLDGFFCNIMGSSGDNWNRYVWMLDEAAANFPGFKVVPMIDANGSMAQNEAASVAAARVNTFLSSSAAWVLGDGRYVVGTFKMEGRPLSYWTSVKDLLLSTHGKNIAFLGVYNSISSSTTYDAIQWAIGRWGPGSDPNIANNFSASEGNNVRGRGKQYMVPVWSQDIRPRQSVYDEASNTEGIRAYGDLLIRLGADLSQACTWSDHSEGTQLRPTVARGQVALDVHSYRLTKWKTGKFPQILRDVAYLSHRNQTLTATITGGQTQLMSPWDRGGQQSTVRNRVEVLTYLTAPATVTVRVAGVSSTYTAPAGEYAYWVNAAAGEVSVKVVRSAVEIARINSPVVIKTTAVNQDRQYFMFSSLRGTAGQYDPTPGSPAPNPANYVA